NRQDKRGGFAGARAGLSYAVDPGDGLGDKGGLNGAGGLIVDVFEGCQRGGSQSQILEPGSGFNVRIFQAKISRKGCVPAFDIRLRALKSVQSDSRAFI